ncbi:MAG TPA: pseudouridine synthase [Bacteroidetes bacterium]|nr:pseudouridine synthase [Bacteroidota bacterium]
MENRRRARRTTSSQDSTSKRAGKRYAKRSIDKEKREENESTVDNKPANFRLNRYLAHAGLASRRKADELIQAGVVKVNGKTVTSMGHQVQFGDNVHVRGKLVQPEQKVYILMNKPKDFLTTTDDERGRRTVLDIIKNFPHKLNLPYTPRVYPVGRLDRLTTGVLLITNDGELTQRLSHPKFGVKKSYLATLNKPLHQEDIELIKNGITLEDGAIQVDSVAYEAKSEQYVVSVELHSGRNRIVRRMFEHLGYEVERLDRLDYGGLNKKNLSRGDWRFLAKHEVEKLWKLRGKTKNYKR